MMVLVLVHDHINEALGHFVCHHAFRSLRSVYFTTTSLISARRAFGILTKSLRISSDFGNSVYGDWFWLSDGLVGPCDIRPLKAPGLSGPGLLL